MMFRLRRFLSYLSRMPRTYGFGVQSPFAYRFVRQVVKGHSHLSLPVALSNSLSSLPRRNQRVYRLFLRFAGFIHSDRCFLAPVPADEPLKQALRVVGCEPVTDLSLLPAVSFSIISSSFHDADCLLDRMNPNGMLVINGIRDNREAFRYWKRLVSDRRVFVSFDLFDVGVLFFDSKMYKRTYCCNY